jgi:FkbM family methyltransferase
MIKRILNKINIAGNSARFARVAFGASYPVFAEHINVLAREKFDGLVFDTPSPLAQWRGRTHLTKEPGTIAWINEFKEGEIFYDVGANIGVYSLYAASTKKVQVFAFEPSPFNFATLSRNIVLNGISENISAFCAALSDKTVLDRLYMSSTQAGAAHTGFQNAINEFGLPLNTVHAQATLGFRMDDFISLFKAPVPHHIKIDVDGAENLVISGMQETLKSDNLKSVLIELPARIENELPSVLAPIIACGFELFGEDHPDGDTRLTNYIFKRKA